MERFSGWIQEDSKRQLMMLESILISLDEEKAKVFRNEVGQRYSSEISQDLDDLEDLLDRRREMGYMNDPILESDINQKIDELSSAQEIAGSFLPQGFADSLRSISQTAKEAVVHMSDLSELQNLSVEDRDGDQVNVKLSEEKVTQFKQDRDKLQADIDNLKLELGKTITASTTQMTEKLSGILDPSRIERGIKDFVSKIGSKKNKTTEEEPEE
jgi:hypothetical protein